MQVAKSQHVISRTCPVDDMLVELRSIKSQFYPSHLSSLESLESNRYKVLFLIQRICLFDFLTLHDIVIPKLLDSHSSCTRVLEYSSTRYQYSSTSGTRVSLLYSSTRVLEYLYDGIFRGMTLSRLDVYQ
jgi:hypothetical protein